MSARFRLAPLFLLGLLFVLPACPDKKAKYPTCEKDKDCKEGEFCINKKCQQCGPGKDCPDGQKCVKGGCKSKDFCESDDECPDGQVCKDNACTACTGDNECGPGKRCSNGACLSRGACKVDEDCADDEDCIDGQCQRPGRSKPPALSCQLQTVYFGFDSFKVEGEAGTALEANAECIKKAEESRGVILNGFTDPSGTEEYNIALSEKRANAAADYLARLGIDPARFRVVPKGEGFSDGSDKASWDKERKVEFEWQ